MALFHECSPQCAQNELDTADIVREAMFRQLPQMLTTGLPWGTMATALPVCFRFLIIASVRIPNSQAAGLLPRVAAETGRGPYAGRGPYEGFWFGENDLHG